MRIDCPYCGLRDASEFFYQGDAARVRPAVGEAKWPDLAAVGGGEGLFVAPTRDVLVGQPQDAPAASRRQSITRTWPGGVVSMARR